MATGEIQVRRKQEDLWFAVHRDDSGEPDGVAAYSITGDWHGGKADSTVTIHLLHAASPQAERELWRHCASIDFASTVEYSQATPDDELRWWLADQRAVASGTIVDGLWVHLHDVPAALSARRYAMKGQVVVQVRDLRTDARESAAGRYRLATDDSGAGECESTTAEPDLTSTSPTSAASGSEAERACPRWARSSARGGWPSRTPPPCPGYPRCSGGRCPRARSPASETTRRRSRACVRADLSRCGPSPSSNVRSRR